MPFRPHRIPTEAQRQLLSIAEEFDSSPTAFKLS